MGYPSTLPRQSVGELQYLASGEDHPLYHVLLLREAAQPEHPNLGPVQESVFLHLLAVLSGGEAGHHLREGGVGSLP